LQDFIDKLVIDLFFSPLSILFFSKLADFLASIVKIQNLLIQTAGGAGQYNRQKNNYEREREFGERLYVDSKRADARRFALGAAQRN
jgi:hypothetical protein